MGFNQQVFIIYNKVRDLLNTRHEASELRYLLSRILDDLATLRRTKLEIDVKEIANNISNYDLVELLNCLSDRLIVHVDDMQGQSDSSTIFSVSCARINGTAIQLDTI